MTPTSINPMNPITEDDIADFLANTPDFFSAACAVVVVGSFAKS